MGRPVGVGREVAVGFGVGVVAVGRGVAGGGAAGTAIVHLMLEAGARHVLVWDREGILAPDDERLSPAKLDLAQVVSTNCEGADVLQLLT